MRHECVVIQSLWIEQSRPFHDSYSNTNCHSHCERTTGKLEPEMRLGQRGGLRRLQAHPFWSQLSWRELALQQLPSPLVLSRSALVKVPKEPEFSG